MPTPPWTIIGIHSQGEYSFAIVPGHPNAHKNDYVLEHRVVMENHLGRLLEKNEVVHHINGDKLDNRIENLEVMLNSEHTRMHNLQKGIGRAMVELCCPWCDKLFIIEKRHSYLAKYKTRYSACSRDCGNRFATYLYRRPERKEEAELKVARNLVREFKQFADA